MLFALALLISSGVAQESAAARAAAEAAGDAAAAASDAAHAEASPYDATRDADADVTAALGRARTNGKLTMIVLGGNWCHDSRALAGHFAEADFAAMLSGRYEVVYVDVGHRDRNLQIPARYGVTRLTGTPTVLIVSPEGQLLNRGTAASWRNAASRSRQNIFAHFRNFGTRR